MDVVILTPLAAKPEFASPQAAQTLPLSPIIVRIRFTLGLPKQTSSGKRISQTAILYVEQSGQGNWRICNSRVSLDSIVHAWRDGQSPEAIAEDFPSLTIEQVYGAVAFYLHNRDEIDQYLSDQDQSWDALRQQSEKKHASLLNRIRAQPKPSHDKGIHS